MSFVSFEFIFSFLFLILSYNALPSRLRAVILLLCSYVFYGFWKLEYIVLLLISTLIDFYSAIYIEKYRHFKKYFVSISLLSNLGILCWFKYANFIFSGFADILNVSITSLDILLPIGISFYTLQTIGYTIDVYKGKVQAEKNFINFALYVSFFPQLVAGPIERARSLIPQIKKLGLISYNNLVSGSYLILLGVFKKLVLANNLEVHIQQLYSGEFGLSFVTSWLSGIFVLFMVYFDFSAYTDIARGIARILGVDLIENFKSPLSAKTVRGFWSQWHISLTKWMTDYVFVPIAKKYSSTAQKNVLLIFVFSLIGLWHGANLTFIVFGLINGIYITIESIAYKKANTSSLGRQLLPLANNAISTILLISFSSIFFYADTLEQALIIAKTALSITSLLESSFIAENLKLFIVLALNSMYIAVFMRCQCSDNLILRIRGSSFHWAFPVVVLYFILGFMNTGNENFVYFQF